MKIERTTIPGLLLILTFKVSDNRGDFVKVFNESAFCDSSVGIKPFRESYYSRSKNGTIRGMHFQMPPFDHQKLVYVVSGAVIDVVLDLRRNSPTFRQFCVFELQEFGDSLFIPEGCAHGFMSKTDNTIVVYNVTSPYSPNHDKGIRWNSFGFSWGNIQDPIISDRDQSFPSLAEFDTPFF